MKILWVFNHPAPYKMAFFDEMGKYSDFTALIERNAESDRDPKFYEESSHNFKAVFLHALKLGPHNAYTGKTIKYLKEKHDVVVINGWSTLAEMKAIRYLRRHKIPYVFAINGGIIRENESKIRRHYKRKYIGGAALYLAPDNKSADYLRFYGADPDKIRLYPYSTIHEAEIRKTLVTSEEKEAFWKEMGVKEGKVFVAVGQLIERKRPLELLEHFRNVSKDCALVYLGSGPLLEKLEEKAKELGMKNVYFPGYKCKKETLEVFAHADASIFLTGEDIYGHVVNESLSQGCPVIGNKNSNASMKLIVDGENGILLGDEETLSNKIAETDFSRMKEKALESSRNETIENMARAHLKIFEDYLG